MAEVGGIPDKIGQVVRSLARNWPDPLSAHENFGLVRVHLRPGLARPLQAVEGPFPADLGAHDLSLTSDVLTLQRQKAS